MVEAEASAEGVLEEVSVVEDSKEDLRVFDQAALGHLLLLEEQEQIGSHLHQIEVHIADHLIPLEIIIMEVITVIIDLIGDGIIGIAHIGYGDIIIVHGIILPFI